MHTTLPQVISTVFAGASLALAPLAARAGTTTAPPTLSEEGGSRTLEPAEHAHPPLTSNPAPTSTGVPIGGQISTIIVMVDGKAVIHSEGRHATLRVNPDQTWWTGTTLAMSYHDGLRVFSQTDLTWWQPGALPASAANLGAILSGSNQVADWIEVETLKAGHKRIWVNVGGKRSRLGIFKADPTASIYLLSPPPPQVGRASIRLSKASGFVFDDAGTPQNTVPKGATALALKAPDRDTRSQWSRDLSKLRGGATTLTWATLLDLDQDGTDEGFACVTGGKDDQDCYVIEPTQAAPHYLGLSKMHFEGGPASAAPRAFKKEHGIYVMHATGSGGTTRLWVARYDGGGYIVEGIR